MDYQLTSTVYLEIDGVPLATPAWEITDLSSLLDSPDMRGGNRVLPGVAGVIAHPLRPTESRRLLPVHINGFIDPEGVPHLDPFAGLEANLADFVESVMTQPSPSPTRTARLFLPSGTTRVGDVQIVAPLGLAPAGRYEMRGVLDLLLIDGALASESGGSS